MKFQKLGNTDIDVSVVALGTWGLGGGSVWTDKDSTVEDAKRLLDVCHEYGVNYIDTAPVYGCLVRRLREEEKILFCRPNAH